MDAALQCAAISVWTVLLASGLGAQWTVGLGAAVPIGSSADRLNSGYNTLLSYSMRPRSTGNYVRLEGAINALKEKTPLADKRQISSGTVNYVVVAKGQLAPAGYVLFGVGTYQKSGGGTRESNPGLNAGAGIKFAMGFFGTFVEARLHYIHDDDKTKYFPMVFGLTF